jgi:hypothetical protein
LAGLALIVLNRTLAGLILREQGRFWGSRASGQTVTAARVVTVLVGIGLVVLGMGAALT